MRPTPVNCAEAVFEPFRDSQLNELARWTIACGDRNGLEVVSGWSMTRFAWTARPDSQWTRMFRKAFERSHGSPFPVVYQVIDDIPAEAPEPRPFVFLPDMGIMASYRRYDSG